MSLTTSLALITAGAAHAAPPPPQILSVSGPNTLIQTSVVEPGSGPCIDSGTSPGCPAAETEPDFTGQPLDFADANADSGKGNPAYGQPLIGTSWVSLTGSDGPTATSGFAENPHWVKYYSYFSLASGKGAALFFAVDNEVTGLLINGHPFDTCSQAAPCGKFPTLHLIPYQFLKPAGNELQIVVRNYGYGLTAGAIDFIVEAVDPPTITINRPVDGGVYALNEVVDAQWDCTRGGADLTDCRVTSGGDGIHLDTAHAGSHAFSVHTAALDGQTADLTHNYTVLKGDQTISFPQPGPFTLGDPATILGATSTSGLPISYALDSGPCTLTGDTLSFDHGGTCNIIASQAGDGDYNAANPVRVAVVVNPKAQTVTFDPAGPFTYGDAPATLSAHASSGLPVAFAVISGPCSVSNATLTINGAGSCDVSATQAGDSDNASASASQTITINKAGQTITFTSTPPAHASVGGVSYVVSATASSGLPVSFTVDPSAASVCALSGSTVSFIGVGTCRIDADQAGDSNYNPAAQVVQPFAVYKAATTLVAFPAKKTLATALRIKPVTFRAALSRTDNHKPISNEVVVFFVKGHRACSAVTDANGIATCTADINPLAGIIGSSYTAAYAGSSIYQASSAAGRMTF